MLSSLLIVHGVATNSTARTHHPEGIMDLNTALVALAAAALWLALAAYYTPAAK